MKKTISNKFTVSSALAAASAIQCLRLGKEIVRYDKPLEALELYRSMQISEKSISNKFTVSSALAATSAIQCLRLGKEIHGYITRSGLDSDEVVWSALSDMYGKCGNINEARR